MRVMTTSAVRPSPRSVTYLGYGGLVPFVGLALLSVLDRAHGLWWGDALFAYGAVILSFVGAVHWGLAMTLPHLTAAEREGCFVWSTVPALLAWPALLLWPGVASLLLVLGFASHYWQDRRLAARANLPEWYLPLRLRLTVVACACLVTAGLAA